MTLDKFSQYDKNFQLKVIKYLINDRQFLVNVRDVLTADHFDNKAHCWLVGQILKYFDEYNTTITFEVIKINLKKLKNDVLAESVKTELRKSIETDTKDAEYVKKEFHTFLKNQEMKQSLIESAELLQEGNYEAIWARMSHVMRKTTEKNIGHEYEKDSEARYRKDFRGQIIPFPWPELNEITGGGLGAADFAIIAGNPGGGKTWTMVSIAANAIKLGFNVVIYSLEMLEGDMGRRFDSCLTGIPKDDLPNNREKVEELLKGLKGKLTIKEYAPMEASVSTLRGHIQRLEENDRKPDLVIIDYVDYLRPEVRGSDRKGSIDDVYLATKALAKDLRVPIITPSQANRAASKDAIIEGDKLAGSYDKLMIGSLLMSVSRLRKDKTDNTARWHIMKSRLGPDGVSFECSFDGSNGNIKILNRLDSDPDLENPKPTSIFGVDTHDREFMLQKFNSWNTEESKS